MIEKVKSAQCSVGTNRHACARLTAMSVRHSRYEHGAIASTNCAKRTQLSPACQTGRRAALLIAAARSAPETKKTLITFFLGDLGVLAILARADPPSVPSSFESCKTNPPRNARAGWTVFTAQLHPRNVPYPPLHALPSLMASHWASMIIVP